MSDHSALLFGAVKNDGTDALVELLARSVDVNTTIKTGDVTGFTALHLTAAWNRLDMTTLLIEAGAKVNARFPASRQTPLHFAASQGARDTALALITAGAEIDATDSDGLTPLHLVARRMFEDGARGVGQLLVEKGANVNARTTSGSTPLHLTVWQHRHRLATVLLDAGADANAMNAKGCTALHFAAQQGAYDAARALVENGAIVEPPRKGDLPSPLLMAVRKKAARIALLLIERGADVRISDEYGTPLHTLAETTGLHDVAVRIMQFDETLRAGDPTALLRTATAEDADRVVSRLVADGGDINVRNERYPQTSLLHVAAEHGSQRAARLLLDRGMDAAGRNGRGQTPLHLAAESGSHEIVSVLLERGVPVDVRDEDGLTPLHEAAYNNAPLVAELLIEHGAVVNAKSPADWTPLHFALLENDGEDRRKLATMLIQRGADVAARTLVAGWTPLHIAVGLNEPRIVNALIEGGSDVNAQTHIGGWTPLHLAWQLSKGQEVVAAIEAAGGEDRESGDAEPLRIFVGGTELQDERGLYSMPDFVSGGGGQLVHGSFTARGVDERLVFEPFGWNPDLNAFVHLAGLVDAGGRTRLLLMADNNFDFADLCRDPVSGLDHMRFFRSPGGASPGEVVYMYYDTNKETLVEVFSDIGDPDFHEYVEPEWRVAPKTLGRGRAADGTCLWRDKKQADQTFKSAMSALRIGKDVPLDGVDLKRRYRLPARALHGETVRKWLKALSGIVTFEGATYADDAGRNAWLVVQVLGTRLWDAEGAVLLHDRRKGTWKTIYDVPSGGSKQLNFPMHGMVVKGNKLYASLCTDCEWWGAYSDFVIDLRTNRAALLDRDGEARVPVRKAIRCFGMFIVASNTESAREVAKPTRSKLSEDTRRSASGRFQGSERLARRRPIC